MRERERERESESESESEREKSYGSTQWKKSRRLKDTETEYRRDTMVYADVETPMKRERKRDLYNEFIHKYVLTQTLHLEQLRFSRVRLRAGHLFPVHTL